MGRKTYYLDTVEGMLELYQAELRQLVRINQKHDYSPAGQAEFDRQREQVAQVKRRIIEMEAKRS